jgi:succinoglycan biosynthesis protein ExoA
MHPVSINQPPREYPSVSVLIPVRNEASFIERSLKAVIEQDYPRDCLEVLIADGLSGDTTREVIESLKRQHPDLSLTVFDNHGKLVATGMNAALRQAKGEVIIRVDGHTIIAPDYIRECVAALQRSNADNVGGRMDAVSESMFGHAVALATSSSFGVGAGRFHYSDQEEWVDTVYMGAWPREVFERVGLFDEEQVRNQDDEFNYRLLSHGGRILLSPRIKSKYYNRSTLGSLWRQYFQYGYWKIRVMQKHPRQMRPRQFVPALFVAVLLVALMLLPFSSFGKYLTLLVVGSYLISNSIASMLVTRSKGWRLLPLLPVAFATLHLGYGCGFLIGLVRFWRRWGKGQITPATPLQKVEQI